MRSIRPLPPRGMTRSTDSGDAIRWPTAARSVVGDQLHRVGRQAGLGERGLHQPAEREVRRERLRAAAQDAGVAALDRQRRGLDRHVRPALVDHREDADRHAHPADADAARLLAQLDRSRRSGRPSPRSARSPAATVSRLAGSSLQAIDQRRGQAGGARRVDVAGVGRGAARQRSRAGAGRARAARRCAPPAALRRACGWRRAPAFPCGRRSPAGRRRSSRIVSESIAAARDRIGTPGRRGRKRPRRSDARGIGLGRLGARLAARPKSRAAAARGSRRGGRSRRTGAAAGPGNSGSGARSRAGR